jgi:hypothetical protein
MRRASAFVWRLARVVFSRGRMIIRFRYGATARINFQPGDEIHVAALTAELQTILASKRLDGQAVCEVVKSLHEHADPAAEDELAVTHRSRRRAG